MQHPSRTDIAYINFLVASPRIVSATEAGRVQSARTAAPAHNAFTRLLHRLEPTPATLWNKVVPLVERSRDVLIVDDATLDKPHTRKMDLVYRQWSGKHHAVEDGINLISLVSSEGSAPPCKHSDQSDGATGILFPIGRG